MKYQPQISAHSLASGELRPRLSPLDPRRVSILQLLEWAFLVEKVRLQFGNGAMSARGYGYVSSTAAIIQHEQLGCRIDGGGRSRCHDDAEAVAWSVSSIGEELGGRDMSLWIAEMARAGAHPDWRTEDRMRVEPVEWKNTKHGRFAKTRTLPRITYRHRGRLKYATPVLCPIRYVNRPAEVAKRRRDYLRWRLALVDVRQKLLMANVLTCHVLTDRLPDRAPWQKNN